jgi:uncharacterized membrane protein YqjE
MELDPSQGTRVSEPSSLDSIRDLVVLFVRYLELRLQLLGLESRETGFHLLYLALLFVGVLICFGGFVIMSVVFLLYLMMLILHWQWGWSALSLAAALLLVSVSIAAIFRLRIAKPLFPATLAEFQKDRELLKHTIKSGR